MQEIEKESVAQARKSGIVTVAFIAQERMRGIQFYPLEENAGFLEPCLYLVAAFERNMRILSSPDVQQFALDLAGPRKRIVVLAFA